MQLPVGRVALQTAKADLQRKVSLGYSGTTCNGVYINHFQTARFIAPRPTLDTAAKY